MRVDAAATGQAVTTGHHWMAYDGVADLHAGNGRAHGFDPACVFVTHDVRQLHFDLMAPDAFHHMQVGAAHTGATDAHDDIGRTLYLRIGHVFVLDEFVTAEHLVVLMQDCGVHRVFSMRGKSPSDRFARGRAPRSACFSNRCATPRLHRKALIYRRKMTMHQVFPQPGKTRGCRAIGRSELYVTLLDVAIRYSVFRALRITAARVVLSDS